jgi:mono/diheme cytochrome c family protein
MKNLRFTVVGLAMVIIALTALNLSGLFESRTAPDPADLALVNLGQVVYADHCAACHSAKLGGEKDWQTPDAEGRLPVPPHDASGHTWHHADKLLLEIIAEGGQLYTPKGRRSNMPGYREKISGREISAVLAFIKSRWPVEILDRQQKLSAQSK